MLNEDEFAIANKLYRKAFKLKEFSNRERFKEVLDYYNDLTGFGETNANSIMHHRISQYGPDCKKCGKPYRTPKATFCAACGNGRN